MKGFFLAILLISLLIVGFLVMRNMEEQKSDQPGKMKTMQKADKATQDAQQMLDGLKKKADEVQ